MNIVLVGLMGSGKSSVGRILATRLDRPFLDTDELIEVRSGQSIPAIFAEDGEAAFRALERDAVTAAASADYSVIATGGGAVLAPENREVLRRTGRVFWLEAPAEELLRRAIDDGVVTRPLLLGVDPLGRLRELMAARAGAYESAAHHRLQTVGQTPEAVAEQIQKLMKESS